MSKQVISYLIASTILFVIFVIPVFLGIYEWEYSVILTISGILSDILGRRFFSRKQSV